MDQFSRLGLLAALLSIGSLGAREDRPSRPFRNVLRVHEPGGKRKHELKKRRRAITKASKRRNRAA